MQSDGQTGQSDQIGGFRRDIQGLRGVAVLLVVLYHTGFAFSGGFVGVDVFFVVSGFVITRMLLRELKETGRIVLRDFYARRVRRIVPVFAVFTLVVLLASVFVLPFRTLEAASSTGAAASTFSANLQLFRKGGGYFAVASGTNPFLHTWTVAVEEQFYLVLPLVLAVAWLLGSCLDSRRRLTLLGMLLGVGVGISLAGSVLMSNGAGLFGVPEPAKFAFYAPVTRAWEFGIGSLIAVSEQRFLRLRSGAGVGLSVAGAVALLAAGIGFSDATVFPGVAALVPVLGTAMLIIGGARRPATALLTSRAIVWIGDISYSWYLWHWPAIVIAFAIWPQSQMAVSVAAFGSLGLAASSYSLVEQPFRRNRGIVGWRAVRLAAIAVVVPLVASLLVGYGARRSFGIYSNAPPESLAVSIPECDVLDRGLEWPVEDCLFRTQIQSVGTMLLLGDSHAKAASVGVIEAGNAAGYDVAVWTRAACPFRLAPTLLTRSDAYCNDYQWAAIDLVASIRADVVVIANRSAFWTSTDPEQLLVPVLGVLPKNQSEALQIWEAGLEAAINASFERGVERIVLIGPVPEFPGSGPALLRRNAGSLSQQALRERRNAVVAVEQAIVAADPRIIYFDPAPILCPTDPCSQLRDGTWLYSDGDHLNSVGSSFLAPDLQVILESLDR